MREDSEDGDYGKLETLDIGSDHIMSIASEEVREEARNGSNEGHERTMDKVNSEEEMENHDSHSEIGNKEEERTKPLVAREPDIR